MRLGRPITDNPLLKVLQVLLLSLDCLGPADHEGVQLSESTLHGLSVEREFLSESFLHELEGLDVFSDLSHGGPHLLHVQLQPLHVVADALVGVGLYPQNLPEHLLPVFSALDPVFIGHFQLRPMRFLDERADLIQVFDFIHSFCNFSVGLLVLTLVGLVHELLK